MPTFTSHANVHISCISRVTCQYLHILHEKMCAIVALFRRDARCELLLILRFRNSLHHWYLPPLNRNRLQWLIHASAAICQTISSSCKVYLSPPSCVILWLCVCFLQLPAPGQLPAVRDGALQEGSVPAVLSALAHRQPQRVGWRGGGPETVVIFLYKPLMGVYFVPLLTLLRFSSAAVRHGQRDFPHGGAGRRRRGGRWVTVYSPLWRSDVKAELAEF